MSSRGRTAVFLDRDGTVMEEKEYLADPRDVTLLPGALEALGSLRHAGLALVMVTNQSGIARGLFREEDYRKVTRRLEALLADGGVTLDAIHHCPHHPDFTGPCDCRKPGPGLYTRSARELGLDLARSYYVGDKLADVQPALTFGGKGFLVRTGYGREEEAFAPPEVRVTDDLGKRLG